MRPSGTDALVSPDSPAEVAERIFQESPYHAIRFLKCEYQDGELTIRGRLPSYYLKQTAQSAVRDLDGVDRISNLTEVAVT
jgi:osmotically-inducible protein OsmY